MIVTGGRLLLWLLAMGVLVWRYAPAIRAAGDSTAPAR